MRVVDNQLVEKLVEDNVGLVGFTINKYYPSFRYDEDLYQIGLIGLWKAAKTFDADKGFKFSSYAIRCIINEMRIELRNRQRHDFPTLSLDENCLNTTGEVTTLGEFLVGDSDVDVTHVDHELFTKNLSLNDQLIWEYSRQGMTTREIGKLLHTSRQTVSKKLRRLKAKWSDFYRD